MIHINLLPVRQIRQRLEVRNEIAIFFASVFVLVLLLAIVTGNKISTIADLKSENKVLSTKKASYQPILNEIEKLKKDKKEQETKLEVIKKLKTGSQTTVRALDKIASLTPTNRLWLKSLKQTGNSVDLTGIALDNATIAQYMKGMTNSEYFSSAELSKSDQTIIAGAKLKSFQLKINIAPLKQEEEPEGKK